jgi:hypothetical protein
VSCLSAISATRQHRSMCMHFALARWVMIRQTFGRPSRIYYMGCPSCLVLVGPVTSRHLSRKQLPKWSRTIIISQFRFVLFEIDVDLSAPSWSENPPFLPRQLGESMAMIDDDQHIRKHLTEALESARAPWALSSPAVYKSTICDRELVEPSIFN